MKGLSLEWQSFFVKTIVFFSQIMYNVLGDDFYAAFKIKQDFEF